MSDKRSIEIQEIKRLYESGANIMQYLRDIEDGTGNSREAILISYDMQAGSYVAGARDPAREEFREKYTSAIAAILDSLAPSSLLEAGVGEATTLAPVARKLARPLANVHGFDISWSRLAHAMRFSREEGASLSFFTGDLMTIPVRESAFDVVLTVHAIEPNRGREVEILRELYRVAGRYVVMLEPSNELGSEATRARMEIHQYCLDLRRICEELGYEVVEHRLFEHPANPENETAVLIVKKSDDRPPGFDTPYGCPRCGGEPLQPLFGNLYCGECLSLYPVLCDMPQLLSDNAILASKYAEFGDICG